MKNPLRNLASLSFPIRTSLASACLLTFGGAVQAGDLVVVYETTLASIDGSGIPVSGLNGLQVGDGVDLHFSYFDQADVTGDELRYPLDQARSFVSTALGEVFADPGLSTNNLVIASSELSLLSCQMRVAGGVFVAGIVLDFNSTAPASNDLLALIGTSLDLSSISGSLNAGLSDGQGGGLVLNIQAVRVEVDGSFVTSFCLGDGSGGVCPCGNIGAVGEGCANSTGSGAMMATSGSNGVLADDLQFSASGLPASVSSLLFAGTSDLSPGMPFGDGLRCAGGSLTRLGVQSSDASGNATWPTGLAAAGGWAAGDRRFFQVWYRDSILPCGSPFNVSNGVDVTFGM